MTSQRSAALVDDKGTRVWERAIQGVTHVVWLDDGSLAFVSAAGVARVDAATGEPIVVRCGWNFGLSSTPRGAIAPIEPLCTQLR